MKTTHDLIQGSAPWQQFRLDHDGASEAAAMLGMSPKVTRAELLSAKHTGIAREFSDWLQANVLDKGHEVEALARPLAEEIIGLELFPVTMSDGRMSASCDGLTIDDVVAWEHKSAAEALLAQVRARDMPAEHMPQCQQVLMVTGAEKLLFMVSDGTRARMAYLWVYPDPDWFQRLRDGWALFHRDLAAYTPPAAAEPAPVGRAPDTLPALRIEVTGQVTASNLAEFKQTALAAIRSVNRDLTTDQDFADADKAIKWCSDVESRLAAAKEHALSQTASIDALFKALDDIAAESKRVRLDLDKLVTRRKTEVRDSAVSAARRALDAHIAALNAEIAPMRVPQPVADFAGAIKGKRSITSMQDALDGVLTVAKIAADADARAIRANVAAFQQKAAGLEFLFADLGALVHKTADDFGALVDARITTHRAAEAKRQADALAEQQRLQRLAEERRAQEDAERQRLAQQVEAQRIQREQEAAAAESARIAAASLAAAQTIAEKMPEAVKAGVIEPAAAERISGLVATLAADAAVAQMRHEPATLTLGAICERLQITVRAEFIADVLHVKPAAMPAKGRGLYTETQFRTICRQLQSHVGAMAELYAGEAA